MLCVKMVTAKMKVRIFTMVNRFVLNGISYHGAGAIKEIPGFADNNYDRDTIFRELVEK